MARTSRGRSIVQGEVFQQALAGNFRFWAAVPDVHAVVFLRHPDKTGSQPLAVVERPLFPPGVCRACGCSEFDPCMTDDGSCAWTDATQTRCTGCA